MISTSFENRIKINEIVSNQIPEFILDENPNAYISSNVQGFMNILEACRNHSIKQLTNTPSTIDTTYQLLANLHSNHYG